MVQKKRIGITSLHKTKGLKNDSLTHCAIPSVSSEDEVVAEEAKIVNASDLTFVVCVEQHEQIDAEQVERNEQTQTIANLSKHHRLIPCELHMLLFFELESFFFFFHNIDNYLGCCTKF